jgi:hypothetical protein
LFDFISYMAIVVITMISRSYQEDIILTLLALIPIVLIKIIYTSTKYKKMGKQLVKLRKTPSDLPGIRTTLIIFILFAIFIVTFSYLSKNHRIGISWLILFAVQRLYERYTETLLQKSIMDNGICTGRRLIEWDTVQSYKWTISKTKQDYVTLKIEYSQFYSFHIAYLRVLIEQKEEVDELFIRMVSPR